MEKHKRKTWRISILNEFVVFFFCSSSCSSSYGNPTTPDHKVWTKSMLNVSFQSFNFLLKVWLEKLTDMPKWRNLHLEFGNVYVDEATLKINNYRKIWNKKLELNTHAFKIIWSSVEIVDFVSHHFRKTRFNLVSLSLYLLLFYEWKNN